MDGLFILGGLILIGIPIAVVYLLVSNANLKLRLTVLEAQIAATSPSPWPDIPDAAAPAAAQTPRAKAAMPAAPPPAQTPPVVEGPPKTFVLSAERFGALIRWVAQNWFYVVSALSLALAGIFLVQYGVEKGLLPPWLRVAAAFAFGIALVTAGEYLRRRFGDDETSSTAYLPSVFSGAGIVTLFSAVLSARLLYGFIGPEVALVGMALVAAVALVLGWFYGPLLAGVGIIGAMGAPFVVGGASENATWLLAYFALVTLVGLAIDTWQRWAWVSVLSLVLGIGAGVFLRLGEGAQSVPYFIIYCALLAMAAIAIPVRKLVPDHGGTLLSLTVLARQKNAPWPEFPTRLAGGAVAAASVLTVWAGFETGRADVFWTAVSALALLALALILWARDAPALSDLVALPALALLIIVAGGGRVWRPFATAALEPEAHMPLMPSLLVGVGVVVSAAAAWRSLRGGTAHLFMAAGAAVFAPALAIMIELRWSPTPEIGGYAWALHAMAIAAMMVFMADQFSRADGRADRNRVSFAVLSMLACVVFAFVILFTSAALTVALAATVLAAAALDRKFNLPLMGLYIFVGIVTVGFRLVADPGIDWALRAPLWAMLLSHGGAVVAFAGGWLSLAPVARPRSKVLLESAVFSSLGILLSLLIFRAIEHWGGSSSMLSHWSLGLYATIWIALSMAQFRRLELGGALAIVRKVLGGLFLLMGLGLLMLGAVVLNPAVNTYFGKVLGPPLFNTMLPAYVLPALVLALGMRWLHGLPDLARKIGYGISGATLTLWVGLSIRHFWRGADGMARPGVTQPELYSYTVAPLLLGGLLFYQSLARQSPMLRRAGLLLIGIAAAKVFLIDISGLGGLIRVFSLLGLGLALAGLAWLNRWATSHAPEEG